jgi:hypothetical protein
VKLNQSNVRNIAPRQFVISENFNNVFYLDNKCFRLSNDGVLTAQGFAFVNALASVALAALFLSQRRAVFATVLGCSED